MIQNGGATTKNINTYRKPNRRKSQLRPYDLLKDFN